MRRVEKGGGMKGGGKGEGRRRDVYGKHFEMSYK